MRILVTPEMARDWLGEAYWSLLALDHARQKIERYASLMRAGQWVDDGKAPVVLREPSSRVRVADGAHRLSAVARAGVAVELEVVEQ